MFKLTFSREAMTKENISVRFLIHLVGERPALWDKTSDDYKDRALKETSWREICTYINENYCNMPRPAREEFTRMITKKWTHIRDSWVKSMKYGYDEVTKEPPKPYVYHKELKFLQKILKNKTPRFDISMSQLSSMHFEEFYREKTEYEHSNDNSQDPGHNETPTNNPDGELNIEIHKQEPNSSSSSSKTTFTLVNKAEEIEDMDDWNFEDTEHNSTTGEQSTKDSAAGKKKRVSIFVSSRKDDNYMEPQTVQPIKPIIVRQAETPRINTQPIINPETPCENRHWNFFKGILPSVNDLDEDNVLKFQSGVISLLQKLRDYQKHKQKQKTRPQSRWLSSHSIYKGRGRKRKASLDAGDDDWAEQNITTSTKRRLRRTVADPIAPEESEYSTDN